MSDPDCCPRCGTFWRYHDEQRCADEVHVENERLRVALPPSSPVADSDERPSNQSLMTRAIQMAERVKPPHTPPKGSDVQYIYEQLKLVRMYASAPSPSAGAAKDKD